MMLQGCGIAGTHENSSQNAKNKKKAPNAVAHLNNVTLFVAEPSIISFYNSSVLSQ